MGSETPMKIPMIDFSSEDMKPGTSSWYLARDEVRRALEEYGCFEAVYNKVPSDLHKGMFHKMEELFDLSTEAKSRNISDKPYYGYYGPTPQVPLYEGLGIDDAIALEQVKSFTNLMWPEGNFSFCETVHSFSKQISELDQMVKRMIFESFGVEKYYDSHVKANSYLLRLMKYKGTQMNEAKLGVMPHTDKSYMTILHQNDVHGLEVQSKEGEWISVTPSKATFLVLMGEAFLAWSNGRLHCPQHRVMISGTDQRYSIGLFSFSRELVQAPEELVDEEHPLLFNPFDQIDLLRFYLTEEGQKAESTIKAYCGV